MESPNKKHRCSSLAAASPPLSPSCTHAPLKAWLASISKSRDQTELGLDRVQVRADPHGGMGLFAAQSLEPGAVVFTVPRAAVVSPHVVNADSAVGLGGALAALPYPFRAALWLVRARRDPEHLFHPFVRTLPAAAPNAPWWSATSRSWLQGSNLGFACDSARNLLATQWAEASQAAGAGAKEVLTGVKLDDLEWGMGCYDSRRLPLRLSGVSQGKSSGDDSGAANGEGVLVPLLDFGNHHPDAEVNWEADADGVHFRLTSSAALPAGAEIFNHYGDKGNEELLMAYGFALPNNPNDVYSLVLSVGTAPPPAPQTKLGPFMLRLPPKIPDGAVEEDANPDSCSSGSNSNSGSSSTSYEKEVQPQFPPALWRALSDPMKYAAEVTGNADEVGSSAAATAADAPVVTAVAPVRDRSNEAQEGENREEDSQQPLPPEASVEVDGDDAYFLLETLRPRLAKARSLLEQHEQRSLPSTSEVAQQATFVGYYFSGQVRVLEEAVASLENILGDEEYEDEEDEAED